MSSTMPPADGPRVRTEVRRRGTRASPAGGRTRPSTFAPRDGGRSAAVPVIQSLSLAGGAGRCARRRSSRRSGSPSASNEVAARPGGDHDVVDEDAVRLDRCRHWRSEIDTSTVLSGEGGRGRRSSAPSRRWSPVAAYHVAGRRPDAGVHVSGRRRRRLVVRRGTGGSPASQNGHEKPRCRRCEWPLSVGQGRPLGRRRRRCGPRRRRSPTFGTRCPGPPRTTRVAPPAEGTAIGARRAACTSCRPCCRSTRTATRSCGVAPRREEVRVDRVEVPDRRPCGSRCILNLPTLIVAR